MRLPRFEYIKPASIEEAVNALELNSQSINQASNQSKILAGGTDLLVSMKQRIIRPATIIGIKSIPELNSISQENGSIKIGAAATLSEIAANELIKEKLPMFCKAVKSVASKHLRNAATIGGNICLDTRCWYFNQSQLWRDSRGLCHKTGASLCHEIKNSDRCHAINNSDTAPALITLDAKVILKKKGGEREIALKDFFKDNGSSHTTIEKNEILTSITIPVKNDDSHSTFIKVSLRKGIDFSIGSIAASISRDGNKISDIRIVIGSIVSAPVLLQKTSSIIMSAGLTEQSIAEASKTAASELGALTNLFTQSGYKRQLAESMTARALTELKEKIKGKGRGKI
ncbi:MAG: FAD binding domain-containing protein [Candidatus Schekmanbacteria bacterium]|nr:FAD binding domain-containing protein [Candidatus Schekmanbacteria bacterium]